MKELNNAEIKIVNGADIIPGSPSDDMCCLNIKFMVIAGRGEPGFDMGVAAYALDKYCDFGDYSAALNYVKNGDDGFASFKDFIHNFFTLVFN